MFVRIKKVGIACKIEIQYESCFSTALHKSYEPIMASVGGFGWVCMQIAEIASTLMTVGNLQNIISYSISIFQNVFSINIYGSINWKW